MSVTIGKQRESKKAKHEGKTYSRAESLEKYEQCIRQSELCMNVIRALPDGTIGCCFCAPTERCHVDIVDKLYREEMKKADREIRLGIIRQSIKVKFLRDQRNCTDVRDFFEKFPHAQYMGKILKYLCSFRVRILVSS